ncbi:20S proteasome subunit alpha 2 [Ochromonadaceae sp. CCMP2298]|nr:20S proteasome subunit alpha 2 [Ochromonadaceae sp. CCMP2298]|eukprot:CAMPEP_0173177086 /NCGR_PEP_ID=MMETSP1141-20130122/4804_1 /TAXON_ID=483371 /ORGANISM="non described non described, Strain CCMP2298" /LENGTH=233 /DNA_ID=CAMNT_0014099465 /DNA_START=117 /DNA_END=818 /DNA_ORIENTATION=-
MGDMNFSLTTFNKSGKLMQIENALARVHQGKMSLGIKAKNGVVIATDRKVASVLVDTEEYQKIQNITPTTGFVFAGMGPDFRVIVRNARKAAQKYFLTYREVQPVSQVVSESAQLMQEYTQSGGVRPFGVSCLVAGYDDNGPQLFQVDPSGSSFGWKATAIGKNYTNAKNFLERRYNDDMELDDAVHIALLTLRESYEGEMTEFNIEVGVVGEDRVFRILTPAEVRDYLDEAN